MAEDVPIRSSKNGATYAIPTGKDSVVGLRTENIIKLAAIQAAREDRRSLSSLCEKILVDFLSENSYIGPVDGIKPSNSRR